MMACDMHGAHDGAHAPYSSYPHTLLHMELMAVRVHDRTQQHGPPGAEGDVARLVHGLQPGAVVRAMGASDVLEGRSSRKLHTYCFRMTVMGFEGTTKPAFDVALVSAGASRVERFEHKCLHPQVQWYCCTITTRRTSSIDKLS